MTNEINGLLPLVIIRPSGDDGKASGNVSGNACTFSFSNRGHNKVAIHLNLLLPLPLLHCQYNNAQIFNQLINDNNQKLL